MQSGTSPRNGVAAAGNWIVDHVKVVDLYPQQDTLANILSVTHGNGGSPYNVLKDLAKLGAKYPLDAIGLIGKDDDGRSIAADCTAHGISIDQLWVTEEAPTSFTDVMTVASTGRRTFFHHRGANALFGPEHCALEKLGSRIFHLGYLLLLDRFDQPSQAKGTVAAELLSQAQQMGMLTSIDVVSEDSQRFGDIVAPALGNTDYCFLNEFEAERTTGLQIRFPHGIDPNHLLSAGRALLAMGVRRWVVIHFPEGGFAMAADGSHSFQPSLRLDPAQIQGTAGAGDAFCAGVLHGFHEGWTIEKTLLLGVSAAASSLSHVTCSGGIGDLATVLKLADQCGFVEGIDVMADV